MMNQILDKLVDMLPNTEKFTLADSGDDCWSEVSPNLVNNWSPNWDKKLFSFCNNSQSTDSAVSIPRELKVATPQKIKVIN